MIENSDNRVTGILNILKSSAVCPDFLLFNPADDWRFKRMIQAPELGLIIKNDGVLIADSKKNRSWIIMQRALRSMGNIKAVNELEKLRRYYHKIKQDRGFLSVEQIHEWYTMNLKLLMSNCVTLQAIETQVQKYVEIYPEVIDFLKYLLDRGVNVCIVSTGIAEVIRLSLKVYGIDPEKYDNLKIFAIELRFSKEDQMTGYYPPTIQTLGGKSLLIKTFMTERGVKDENIIGIGDSLADRSVLNAFDKRASMVLFFSKHTISGLKEADLVKMPERVHAAVKKEFGIFTDKIKEIIAEIK